MSLLPFVCCLILLAINVDGRNPGLKARITQKGLSYANSEAIKALQANIKKTTIPDQKGKASGFKYEIQNIHVTQFNPPSSSISFLPGKGLQWKADNGFIEIEGKFKYKKWFVKDSGTFTAKVSGVNFNADLDIGSDADGKLHIKAGACTAGVGDVDFKFHGGMAWLYNLFRSKVSHVIKDKLNSVLKPEIVKAIDVDAEAKMKNLPMMSKLAKKFLLDYTLTAPPFFTTGYLETYHKGEVYWGNGTKSEAPFSAPSMPRSRETQNMMYLWLSDYVLDTFMYQAQMHGYLVRNVTNKDLPPENRGVLNTSCAVLCIGKFLPEVGKKYPNSSVELRMKSTQVPKLKISVSGISASFAGNIDLYASVPGKADTPFLVTLVATMSADMNVSVSNQKVYAVIKNISLNLKAGKSSIGPIDEKFMNFLINQALRSFILPKLNELGAHGFPLPVTKNIAFVNSKLVLLQDVLQISTDIKYTPTADTEIHYEGGNDVIVNVQSPEIDLETYNLKSLKFLKDSLKEMKDNASY